MESQYGRGFAPFFVFVRRAIYKYKKTYIYKYIKNFMRGRERKHIFFFIFLFFINKYGACGVLNLFSRGREFWRTSWWFLESFAQTGNCKLSLHCLKFRQCEMWEWSIMDYDIKFNLYVKTVEFYLGRKLTSEEILFRLPEHYQFGDAANHVADSWLADAPCCEYDQSMA